MIHRTDPRPTPWAARRATFASGPLIAPLLARAIVAAVYSGLCVVAFLHVLESAPAFSVALFAAVALLILLALQVCYFSRPGGPPRSRLTYWVLGAQACLVFVPAQQFGQAWVALPSLLAGTVLLVLPPAAAVTAFVAILAIAARNQEMLTHSVLDVAYIVVGGLVAALEVFGLTRLAGLITDLHAARSELGKVAVARERTRFARDLHDLLGLSLAAIVPKSAAASAALTADPDNARAELREILVVARHALADVRLIANGYRELSLREESRTVEALLAASNVDVRMELNHGELPAHIRSVVVAVLRAGVANVLHHTSVARCDITMRQAGHTIALDIVDDGVTGRCPAEERSFDGGLESLADRVRDLGGTLVEGPDPDGRFGLHLTIPVGGRTEPACPPDEVEQVPRYAALLATGLMNVVFVGFLCAAMLHLLYLTRDPLVLSFSAACLAALVALQLLWVSRPGVRIGSPSRYVVVAVQAVLVYLPLAVFPQAWVSVPGLLAGTALLVFRPATGWLGFVAVVTSVPWAQGSSGLIDVFLAVTATVITGLVTYGLTWMAGSVSELRAARRALAEAAVAQERLRFARDLHDLLGLSLSAITLKAELAHRALKVDPARAAQELGEIISIARLALADVRLVAGGYRDLSLNEESRSVESVLAAANVDVRMDLRYGELRAEVRTVLATVLREGVTNVLRHSRGGHCEISVRRHGDRVVLEIVNDGVSVSFEGPGNGIRNLTERVATVGGDLTAGVGADGMFRLRAQVPA
ncbi:sensor histidine kinase [Actinokineospora sp.]|uniref:sensor histidine kinase n=1 Tax=Actinokineospora sp. TaxID=1872133 RepID=UPI003D6B9ED8